MKHRLNHETGEEMEEESSITGDQRTEKALTFETPEEMLRYDAANTQAPAQMRERVMQSIAQEPAPKNPKSWWKRWMPF
ncbi:MAG TPA: hypothetical protein VGE67_08635 [Haloferula sp.]